MQYVVGNSIMGTSLLERTIHKIKRYEINHMVDTNFTVHGCFHL